MRVEAPAVPFTQLAEMPPGSPASEFRAQVLEARAGQSQRFDRKSPLVNGRMTPRQLRKPCQLKPLPDGPPGPTPRAGPSPCEMGS
jgi:magnesium chelatase family protein